VAHQAFKLRVEDFEKITINSMKSAFIPHNRRIQLIYDVIKPGYAQAVASLKKQPQPSE
jgi:adenosine deaminase